LHVELQERKPRVRQRGPVLRIGAYSELHGSLSLFWFVVLVRQN
jgi:hypothetical protein